MSTAALAPPATAAPPGLPDLILLRLLVAKGSVPPKKLRDDLAVLFRRPPAANEVTAAVAALRAEGYVAPRGQQATDAGRARAMQFLGVDKLPPRANWGTVKAKFLVPRVLGVDAAALTDGKKLAAVLLKRELGLPPATRGTLAAVFEAIACRALGFADHVTLKSLIPPLLARQMGADAPPVGRDAAAVVPRVLLKAGRGVNGLRTVALTGWADGQAEGPQSGPTSAQGEESFDLTAFARAVAAAARACPTGRFDGDKVFISHVWQRLRDEPRLRALGPDGFKARLVEANQARQLNLLPADMNQAFDERDLSESRTQQRNSTYHFIDTGAQA